jgi:hypothetical protein
MWKRFCLIAVFLSAAGLQAQSQSPSSQQPAATRDVPQVLQRRAYIRRFSLGATLSVLSFRPIRTAEYSIATINPTVQALYTTEDLSQRIGWGGAAQAAITERLAVNAGFLLRRFGYKMVGETFLGATDYTAISEMTLGKYFEVPMLVRFYTRGRHRPGPHWFVEGGAVIRRATKIKTLTKTAHTIVQDDVVETRTPAIPVSRTTNGYTAGIGLQLIDPLGIRVVPEVRYTRWMNRTFNNFSTHNDLNQVEVNLSLTF